LNNQIAFRILLRGGLGNQLFQYFSARELAAKTSASLVLDARLLPPATRHSRFKPSEFPEEISSFLHDGKIVNSATKRSLSNEVQRWLQVRIAQHLRASGKNQVRGLSNFFHFSGNDAIESAPIFSSASDLVLNHPFLNPSIFQYPKDQSVRTLESLTNPSPWFSAKKAEILRQRPLAIHHRLGDHVHLGTPATLDYIVQAISTLKDTTQSEKILVFTDDISKSREILNVLPYSLEYIEPPIQSRPIESLVLMAKSRALVMSSSSFSWWAGTLGSHSGLVSAVNSEWLNQPATPEFFRKIPSAWVRV
jgi:hypothetical protein